MVKYGNKKPDMNVLVGNEMLEWASSYKYLGIELHSNGNMTNCSKNLCNRSWKAIFMLNASLKHSNGTTRTRLLLFDKLVKPILNYNCEIWGNILQLCKNKINRDEFWKKVDTLPFEILHLRYMKIILGIHSKATNAAVRGKLGRYPLALSIVKSMMGFGIILKMRNMLTLYSRTQKQNVWVISKSLDHGFIPWNKSMKSLIWNGLVANLKSTFKENCLKIHVWGWVMKNIGKIPLENRVTVVANWVLIGKSKLALVKRDTLTL